MVTRSFFLPKVPEIPVWVRRIAKDDKWTISQERVFMEDLVYKRMSTFLVIAGALLTGAINLEDRYHVSVPLLALGSLLCWVLQQTIYRAQVKLDIILAILFADNSHPTGYINTVFGDAYRVRWVGYLVPLSICILLTGLTLFELYLYLDLELFG
jgi:hypothetical protein